MELKKPLNFLKVLPNKLNRFYSKMSKSSLIVNNKSGNKKIFDPVTNFDRSFEKYIRSIIEKSFPEDGIIGEEFKDKNSYNGFRWSIDPIDGTRSFVIGNPTWSNLISLNYKVSPIIGLANFPILKKFYFNTSKKNAYVSENGNKRKLRVNSKVTFSNMKMSAAFHGGLTLKQQKKIPQILKRMQFPCVDALSYSHFAEGKVDVVLQCSNKIWDIHPLIPIIQAAGGIISTWTNQDATKAGKIICSSNNSIHKKVLKILKPVSR